MFEIELRVIAIGVEVLEIELQVIEIGVKVFEIKFRVIEIEVLEIQRDTEALGGDLEHAKALRHYFATDAIAGHHGNLVTHGNVS